MQAEYTGVKIKLGDEEKIITPQQAKELRDALTQLLGPKSLVNPYAEYMARCTKAAPDAQPFPGQLPAAYCGTTSFQAVC